MTQHPLDVSRHRECNVIASDHVKRPIRRSEREQSVVVALSGTTQGAQSRVEINVAFFLLSVKCPVKQLQPQDMQDRFVLQVTRRTRTG